MVRSQPKSPQRPPLLATTTHEPFQPVRLTFAVPDAGAVRAKLKRIACVQEVPAMDCREWLFAKEEAGLRFPGTCQDVPEVMRPIVLGRIRFPRATAMTLQTNSFHRALKGARFFGARLGKLAAALRVRVINRCFAADEGDIQNLASMLDRDVVVVDPREAELVIERMIRKGPNKAEALQRLIWGDFPGGDVPMVEEKGSGRVVLKIPRKMVNRRNCSFRMRAISRICRNPLRGVIIWIHLGDELDRADFGI